MIRVGHFRPRLPTGRMQLFERVGCGLAVTTEWNLKMDTLIIIEFQKAVQA